MAHSRAVPAAEQQRALTRLQGRVPAIKVDWDDGLGSPKWIRNPRGLLTDPPTTPASVGADPDEVIKRFLGEYPDLFGHGPEALTNSRVTREFVGSNNGLRTVVWQQQWAGWPVFGSRLTAHTTRDGQLASLSSLFLSNPEAAARRGGGLIDGRIAAPNITATTAIARAASNIGVALAATNLVAVPAGTEPLPSGHVRYTAGELAGAADAQLVWLPLDRQTMSPAWEIILMSRARREMHRVLIDARTGEAWLRHSLTEHSDPASYRVFLADSPTPFSPAYATPNATQPPTIARVLVTTNAYDSTASPNGWINDGDNQTLGNNVDAFLDGNGTDTPSIPRPQGSPFRVFDAPLNLAQAPSSYPDAAVINLFFWNNWMHDQLYELGFTEAAGNFQTDNFGRGGAGNDAVQAEAQDGGNDSSDNNASFTTPPDGMPGIMEMHIWTGPTPNRDCDLDTQIILHEYAHGLSNRRVGGGAGITALQSRGLGEGWSDFYSLALLSKPGDDVNGTYPEASYSARLYNGLTQNYYYGIRRYPYSTDLTKDPVTFKDIDPNQISHHPGVPISPVAGPQPAEIHNQGEIWGAALWEIRANLIRVYGDVPGNRLSLQLVTDALNLTPADPTFTQARDAVILADIVDNQGTNFTSLWQGFAKRGLGSRAVAPANTTTVGVVESFTVPDPLVITPAADWDVAGPLLGALLPAAQVYTLENTLTNPISWRASVNVSWATLSASSGVLPPNGAGTNVAVQLSPDASTLPAGDYTGLLTFTDGATGATETRKLALSISAPRRYFEGLDQDPGWSRQGQWEFGRPQGLGGAQNGHADPDSGKSGTNVFGVNLAGDYVKSGGGPYYLTAGPWNFTGMAHLALQFARWLNTDAAPFATATVEISNDGINWNSVYANDTSPVTDFEWTTVLYDISAWADNQPAVYVRWGYGASPMAFVYSGWNIDDVAILGSLQLSVGLPAVATKGAGLLAGQGRLTIAQAPTNDLRVSLTSSDPSRLLVPDAVIIPAGRTQATFDLTIPDNHLLDGTRRVSVVAGSLATVNATNSMDILDNESALLTLNLPAEATQGDGAIPGLVSASAAPAADIVVSLVSSDPLSLQVPPTIVLPAGRLSVTFTATVPVDSRLLGDHTVVAIAQVTNWTTGTGGILIHGSTNFVLNLLLPGQLRPSNGTVMDAGAVQIPGPLLTNLSVSLAGSNATGLVFPATVILPAGQVSTTFNLGLIPLTIPGGSTTAGLSANADGFAGTTGNLQLVDDQTPPPPFNPNPPDLSYTNPVTVQLSWLPGLGEGVEQLGNGDFESGSLAGWTATTGTNGGFYIDDGSVSPPSQDGPTPPFEGRFSAIAYESQANVSQLFQELTLPPDATATRLCWADRIRNFAGGYATNQEFRVEVRNTNDTVLAVLFATVHGMPLLNDWTLRGADLSRFRGQRVRIAFLVTGLLGPLDVHLDSVSLRAANLPPTIYDVYLGTNGNPNANRLLGSTTNLSWPLPLLTPGPTNYWSIVARRGNATASPWWQFVSLPTVFVNDLTVTENPSGNTNAVFTVTLLGASAGASVDFMTVDGTATAPGDYQATSGTLQFSPADPTLKVRVAVHPYFSAGPLVSLGLILTNPINAALGRTGGRAIILEPGLVAPALSALPNRTNAELALLSFTNLASEFRPHVSHTFSLDSGAPAGASIDPTTGIFRWTPTETQGPGVYWVSVRVTDDGQPPLSAFQGCLIAVTEANSAPVMSPIPNFAIHAQNLLTFTAQASDPDQPGNFLTFSLASGAPVGAQVDPTSGTFSWVPTESDTGTNYLTLLVTDDGFPPLTTARSFNVAVAPPLILSPTTAGSLGITLSWPSLPGLRYRIQSSTDLNQVWTDVPGDILATGENTSQTVPLPANTNSFYRLQVLP